jgi:hypothetical protein
MESWFLLSYNEAVIQEKILFRYSAPNSKQKYTVEIYYNKV